MEHSLPVAATELRPFAAADAPEVATLFVGAMRHGRGRANPALAPYLVETFVTGPFADPEIPSHVAVDGTGAVIGFTGALTQTIALDGKTRRLAIGTTLMVRDHHRDPMTGARLLRALLNGPQDATISETASEESLPMWEKLGGETLPLGSLEWLRVLRPAAFGISAAARRFAPLAVLGALATPFDNWATRRKPIPTWTSMPDGFKPRGGLRCVPIDATTFAAESRVLLDALPVRPVYSDAQFARVMDEVQRKPERGAPQFRRIETPNGKPIGVALYHFSGRGIARLHTMLAPAAHRDIALDAVLIDARDAGAAGMMGRSEPDLFEALSRRRAVFLRASGTLIHTRDDELRELFRRGALPLNGLFGERWIRLIGDSTLWS